MHLTTACKIKEKQGENLIKEGSFLTTLCSNSLNLTHIKMQTQVTKIWLKQWLLGLAVNRALLSLGESILALVA